MFSTRIFLAALSLLALLELAALTAQASTKSVATRSSGASDDRAAKALTASRALLDLEFTFEGRGMIAPPGLPPFRLDSSAGRRAVHAMKKTLEDDFGLIVENDAVVGYHDLTYKNRNVGVVGCAVCHAGRAAGLLIPGLGNKTIDIFKLARAAQTSNPVTPYWPDRVNQELHDNAMHFINEIGNPELASKTRGLIPIGLIRKWFFDIAGEKLDNTISGSVKIPALWGYGEKKERGSFSDGFGKGVLPGWAIAVELVAGQRASDVHQYVPKIEAAEKALSDLLPPPYPFEVDQGRAQRGQKAFDQVCSRCHGTYEKDKDGYPVYKQPVFIPLEIVQTDSARVDSVTPRFRELVKASPLNDIIQATDLGQGYFAQRLNGIWARFPYFHNGSVPTLYAVLNPLARPALFSLERAGERDRFDSLRVGLTTLSSLSKNDRSVYDTSLFEHSNQGHDWPQLKSLSDTERFEIIEYLKTL